MRQDQDDTLRAAPDGGVSGDHPAAEPFGLLVAPSTADQFNAVSLGLIPIACFRVDDVEFQFDSSFPLPAVQGSMHEFQALRKGNENIDGAPISIFGHADPSFQGNFELGSATQQSGDDYNKDLSGRRARAVYGLLIRDTALWDDLYKNHLGHDVWGEASIRTMLEAIDGGNGSGGQGSSSSQNPNTGATTSSNDSKVRDIANDPGQRKQLFQKYMDFLCGDLKLDGAKDFLARSSPQEIKGKVQGCGRFNPVILFNRGDEDLFKDAFEQKDVEILKKRNNRNRHNRRVMILIFRKGSQVLPTKWPCPTAKEGAAGCVKRFFSDGNQRRSQHPDGDDKRFADSEDTFACRFYQRISNQSPCHQLTRSITLQLLYEDNTPMADAEFQAIFDDVTITGTTDKDGRAGIAAPEDGPDTFRLVLTSFPERYKEGEDKTAVAAKDESDGGPQALWPHNALASLLFVLLPLTALLFPACALGTDLPAISAGLKGPLYTDGGRSGTVELALSIDTAQVKGTITYSGRGRFTLIEPKLEVLETSGQVPVVRARYRLVFDTDACENAAPLPKGAQPGKWDQCLYNEGDARPVRRVQGEILLTRDSRPSMEVLVAVGIPNLYSLAEVFRATGSVTR